MSVKNIFESRLTRRSAISNTALSIGALMLSACTSTAPSPAPKVRTESPVPPHIKGMYGYLPNERFPVPAVDILKIPPRFYRQVVDNPTGERAGTIVVDTNRYYLYLVLSDNKAMRYGVGLGRAGFGWSGKGVIQWKQKWPTWTPPAEMIERQPELAKYSAANGGMSPGLDNALGARALYIFQDGQDTLYRLHGTMEEWSIGKAVSSGCVRLLNHDVINLYDRVTNGSPIIVR